MIKTYTDKDAKARALKDKTVAILGYGSQGHAQAQNLRDSGVKVIVAEHTASPNYAKAKKDKFKIYSVAEATKRADVIHVLLPDELQKRIYDEEIAPNLTAGKALGFSHGFNIHFGQIVPPAEIDVYMVAPKGPGHLVRRMFEEGKGVPALFAIYQDASGKAQDLALAYAKGLGSTRALVYETTFKDETETDLFGEQAVLCGGLTSLIQKGFEVLTEAGYPAELAYYECLHEVKLIVDLIVEGGFNQMRDSVSNTAEYGDYTRGDRVVDQHAKDAMWQILREIQSGQFAREWMDENASGCGNFNKMRGDFSGHQIELIGPHIRAGMVWLQDKKTKKSAKKTVKSQKVAKKTLEKGEKEMKKVASKAGKTAVKAQKKATKAVKKVAKPVKKAVKKAAGK